MAVDKCTLLIRHLPPDLPVENVEELLKTVGAIRIRTVTSKGEKKQLMAFATFENPAAALSVMQRLHQLEMCGRRLVVVYAFESQIPLSARGEDRHGKDDDAVGVQKSEESMAAPVDYTTNVGLISELLGLNYPFSSRLRYRYPDPTPATIRNIAIALMSVPKLYWQVLHLMNKMNLQPPFESTNQPMQNIYAFDQLWQFGQQQLISGPVSSSEESELESDHENNELAVPKMAVAKRKRSRTAPKVSKRSQIHSLLTKPVPGDSAAQTAIAPEDVFDLANPHSAKKIEFKISAEAIAEKTLSNETMGSIASEVAQGSFGTIPAVSDKSELTSEGTTFENNSFITNQMLRENRISAEGMSILPVYKNYQTGKASSRLYLKNLAKQVEEKDLHFIYGRYITQLTDETKAIFQIRLMKEGRMKGQAFITFPDEVTAAAALKDTNGYVLYGKPIVVQYAHQCKS